VTAEAAPLERPTHPRPRPRVHFTADAGWINDPYGVAWIDGEYHLYYQAIPGRVTWAPNCHWGHARSRDLVHWEEQALALTPQGFEVGCWSGSVVDEAEPPVIFYTRVSGGDWEIGQVAMATLDRAEGGWRTSAGDVVIAVPPPELGLRCFRDPNVFRSEQGWRMLMAAAFPDGVAAVLQYSSSDLRHWVYDGVLCSRRRDPSDEVYTGSLWECPHLFRLDEDWVLLVSIWDEMDLLYVAAALGSYDGTRFHPRSWQRLTHGCSAYAMTTFVDREGRRCVLSWLREEPRNNPALTQRAGAHSLVSTLSRGPGNRLVLQPHPQVDAALAPPLNGKLIDGDKVGYDVGRDAVDVRLLASPGPLCEILDGDAVRARLVLDARHGVLTIDRPGYPTGQLPAVPADGRIRLLLDADILEIFTSDGYGAYRIAPASAPLTTALVVARHGAQAAEVRPFSGPDTSTLRTSRTI
jgi:beta-fructofuranosidase